MPHSRPNLKPELWAELERNVQKFASIVDIGAGDGETGVALRERGYTDITAIEVHAPYIPEFDLRDKYDVVMLENAWARRHWPWDVAIATDVLEHMTVGQAQWLIYNLKGNEVLAYFIVPWLTPQGAWRGIEWEVHHQEDLTPIVMTKRYPDLELLKDDGQKGLYVLR
jgi:hypothetical protein